jgi:hypothetical protein
MADFVMKLSYETWDPVFGNVGIDTKFNSFLTRMFYSGFPFKRAKNTAPNNTWMTTGIKISCEHIKELHLMSRDSHDPMIQS